jgi:Mg-chelatase subunit ChlD
MLRSGLLFLYLFLSFLVKSQLDFSSVHSDLGIISEAYEIQGDVVISNNSQKKIFLMRADADRGVKVYASKKTLLPGDTSLLVLSFIPDQKGKFNKNIKLVTSDQNNPYALTVSGTVNKLKTDDKTACFYFGSRKNPNVKIKDEPVIITEPERKRDASNKMPDNPSEPIVSVVTEKKDDPSPRDIEKNESSLSLLEYKPNNIVFLVDVSNSMKDSMKLPLMKIALYTLIDAVRDVDKITFLTYADSVRVIEDGISGAEKEKLKQIVSSIKARGMTKGNKAILRSQQIAQKHFIPEGNNQIILASDGEFKFYEADYKRFEEAQKEKPVILTTVAFGDDKAAAKNLKEIAEKGKGSFIHVKKKHGSEEKILEEIKLRSKR